MWDRYDPRDDDRDRGSGWDRSLGGRGSATDRNRNHERDSRDVFIKDLDLPRGRERQPVRERERVYEIDGAESRALATIGAFRVVAESDLQDIRIDAKRQALDALDAARRSTAHNGDGNWDGGANQTEIPAIVEVSDDLTSQSRHSLLLQGSPPSGKLLIPLNRRDVRVVEGARLESDSGNAHRVIRKHLFA